MLITIIAVCAVVVVVLALVCWAAIWVMAQMMKD